MRLIIGAAWVGDAVLSQPLLRALKTERPDQPIAVLAPPWTHGVLARLPEVDEILTNPFAHGVLDLRGRYTLGRSLSRRGFSDAWVLPNAWKAALIPWFAGIPRRVGYLGEMRYGLLTEPRRLDPRAHPLMAERFLALAHPPGSKPTLAPPRLQPNLENQQITLKRLGLQLGRPVAVLCPGAEYGPAKRWPEAHFAALARTWIEAGYQVWILGSPKDVPVAQTIEALAPGPVHNLCGNTRLEEAVDLMALADRVVSNDSGLMHVAAALDRPLVALFGSSSPQFTPPLSSRARVVRHELPCSPCFKRNCPLGHLDCLVKITPDEVQTAFGSLISAANVAAPTSGDR